MAERRARPNVFSIPAGAPFLPTLADAFLSGRLGAIDRTDPLAMADVTIFLPTRRAVRALRDLLADRVGSEAAILPTIRPIGDASEEDHAEVKAEKAPRGFVRDDAVSSGECERVKGDEDWEGLFAAE